MISTVSAALTKSSPRPTRSSAHTPEDITRLKTRNDKGEMVPLGAVVKVTESHGPDRVMRYNGYPAAEINGGPAPGFSSGQAEAAMAKLAAENLPRGMAYEWTELTYQRILAGNTAVYVDPLCILLVFLVLAALYESFRLPLAIILIVPMCLLFAITGVWLKGSDNNIFTQIGLIVLVGLACKNAILIVEFAKRKQDEGMTPFDAAIEACRLRLRPILMTSIAFIAGVFPLVVAQRRRRGNAAGDGHRRVLRHDRRDAVRSVPDAGFLCHADETWPEEKTGTGTATEHCSCPVPAAAATGIVTIVVAVHRRVGESELADRRAGLQTADQFRSRELQGGRIRQLEGRPAAGQCAEGKLVGDFWRHQSERVGDAGVVRPISNSRPPLRGWTRRATRRASPAASCCPA